MTTSLHRQVEKRLTDHDARYTRGRRTVVDALAEAEGPRSAAELTDELDGLPLSSLYRTLAVLEEADIVTTHLATKGIARYELAEWLTGHHHHLVCVECGQVDDVVVPTGLESQVDRIVNDIATQAAFTAIGHALEIEGRCARCT